MDQLAIACNPVPAIAASALVCKAWAESTKRYLWESIELHHRDSKRLQRLRAILRASPDIARHIRRVTFTGKRSSSQKSTVQWKLSATVFLDLCTSLHTLVLRTVRWEELPTHALRGVLGRAALIRLELHDVSFHEDVELRECMGSITSSLREMKIDRIHRAGRIANTPVIELPVDHSPYPHATLRRLTLSAQQAFNPRFLRAILSYVACDSLETLDVTNTELDQPSTQLPLVNSVIRKTTSTLKTLHIHHLHCDTLTFRAHNVDIDLTQNTTLHTISIKIINHRACLQAMRGTLCRITPSHKLERIDMEVYIVHHGNSDVTFAWSYFDFLLGSAKFKHLRSVRLTFVVEPDRGVVGDLRAYLPTLRKRGILETRTIHESRMPPTECVGRGQRVFAV